ncbi:MAG: hypothetical protein JO295_13530 [Verrucomicrobia bacterium]|nr:hypothetical protein [Verrucomicrobiota bacterium]
MAALPFRALLVLDDPQPRAAAWNMACDEAWLEQLAADSATPTTAPTPLLRVYRWTQPAVSLGYFTPLAAIAGGQFINAAVVRRWTGGGVVAHGDECDWTYSLIVPHALPLARLRADESYRFIHLALLRALQQTHDTTEWTLDAGLPHANSQTSASHVQDAAATPCFVRPVRADVLCAGQKVAGAAQRRSRAGLLHQGSVQGPARPVDATMRLAFLTAFADALCPDRAAQLWHHGHLESWPNPAAAAVAARAENLATTKYATAAWLHKR